MQLRCNADVSPASSSQIEALALRMLQRAEEREQAAAKPAAQGGRTGRALRTDPKLMAEGTWTGYGVMCRGHEVE